jgi:energy-coupling factor transporter ATP-binding protein EcfA2
MTTHSEIKSGEHVVCVGQTGSGKSVMLQELLKQTTTSPVFVMDSKADEGFLSLPRSDESMMIFDEGLEAFTKFIRQPPRKIPDYVIIRPPLFEVTDPDILDKYILMIHLNFKGKCIICVDELYMLHKNGRCGVGLSGALTRGRSKGHSLYGATQRPSWISRFCISEMSHYFIFRLMEVDDRKRFSHIGYDKTKMLDRYHYFMYNSKTGEGGENPPLTLNEQSNVITSHEKGRWV